jgi:thiol:disulfide interchange protein DsbD
MASNVFVNLLFFVIFMLFAFSFLGAFELSLPASWTNKADANSEKQGFTGIFFMAFTLALVSFSCTGPFIGNMLVQVSQGNGYLGPIAGMGGFATAFALPFIVFAAFPMLMHKLPKSGGWLNSVKVVFGFLELALALKFLSSVDLAYHWGILKREYFLAIWIIIAILMGFYLLGKIRFSHDTPVDHVTIPRLLLAIIIFSFAAYMIPGLWGAPVKMLGGIAPPYQYNEGFIQGIASGNVPSEEKSTKKYAGLFESPFGLDAYYDYDEGLAAAKKSGKPLMLDFTGHACTNCRRMEENVWGNPEVLSHLKNDYILVSLYVDDKTGLPDSERYYSKILESKVKTIGDKWSDLEASRYNTNAQPLYVLLDHNEQMLNDPYSFDTDVDKFAGFLESGKAEFSKRQGNLTSTAQQ